MVSNQVTQAIKSAQKYSCIVRVGVFGSYARGEETPASDLDILVDYDNSSDAFLDDLGNLMEDIESVTNTEVGYVTMNGLMKSPNKKLRSEVLRDVQWIYTA